MLELGQQISENGLNDYFNLVEPVVNAQSKEQPQTGENLNQQSVEGARVLVVMGSSSDWSVMCHAHSLLEEFGVLHECRVVSAHRTPQKMYDCGLSASERGVEFIIAGAGGAAHLPGMLAAITTVPVLGVPVPSKHLSGQDSLYSIVQMPRGVPVATFAIGEAGAGNAALFAIAALANNDPALQQKLQRYRSSLIETVEAMTLPHGQTPS